MTSWTVDGPQQLTFDEPIDRLEVNLVAGRLNVVATDGPARVEVDQVSRWPIVVEQQGGRLRLRQARFPRWPGLLWWLGQLGRRFRVDVSVAVPAQVRADLRLVAGSMVVSRLTGETRLDVTSGQITLMGLAGRTAAKLVSGPIQALGIGGDLTLESVSGELILADSVAARVHASTVSGAITCDLDSPQGSDIRLGTTSGSVTVRVREDSDLTVRLHTTAGRITSGFPQVPTSERTPGGRDSQGVLGSGEGRLRASSVSGSISLLARPVDDEPVDVQPIDDEPADGRPIDDEPDDVRVIDEEPDGGRPAAEPRDKELP